MILLVLNRKIETFFLPLSSIMLGEFDWGRIEAFLRNEYDERVN